MKIIKYTVFVLIGLSIFNCVQETHLKTISFKVDMRNVENPSQVGIRGSFTDSSWNETLLMTDEDKDGVYELTVQKKTAVRGIEFKFVNEYEDFELEDQNNRTILFQYQPETLLYEAVFNNPKGKQTSIK